MSPYVVVFCIGGLVKGTLHDSPQRNLPGSHAANVTVAVQPPKVGEDKGNAARTFSGTIVMVERDHVTLARKGEWTRFLVSPDAMISVNSAEAPLEELLPGHLASIVGANQGSSLVATVIDAKRQY